jgi:hypothetical protein
MQDNLTDQAAEYGRDAGRAAASWVFDGNSTEQAYRWVLRGIEDGDPEVLDAYRVPDLSGEYQGDLTDRDLAIMLGSTWDAMGQEALDDAADAYLNAASQSFWDELERIARHHLPPAHCGYPHEPGRLYDCPACESKCHCTPGDAECIFAGEHNGLAARS